MPGERFRGMTRKQRKAERVRIRRLTSEGSRWWELALADATSRDMRERQWRRDWLEAWMMLGLVARF